MFIANSSENWKKIYFRDLVNVRYGKDHKKLSGGTIPVYGSGGIMRYVDTALYNNESVLIPRKGTLNNVIYVNDPFWSVDTMFYTEMQRPNIAKFVYHFISSKDLASMNAGTAVPSMTTDILNSIEVIIPSQDTFDDFDNIVSPIYQQIQMNNKESNTLSRLRDALLPKLMAGEIDVSTVDI